MDGKGAVLAGRNSSEAADLARVNELRERLERLRTSGRVAPGDCSPGAPADPYVQHYRIRFLK